MNRLASMLLGVGSAFALSTMGCAIEPGDEELIRSFEQELAAKSSRFWHAQPGSRTVNIPVCFLGGSGPERKFVKDEAERWAKLSSTYGAKFTGWGDCNLVNPYPNYVIQIKDQPYMPGVGYLPANPNVNGIGTSGSWMTLYRQNSLNSATILHEFGHVLGFTHEANRSDSPCDDTQGTYGELGITAYDSNSIMGSGYCNSVSSLSFNDQAGYLGVYGGRVVPTTGTALLGIRNSQTDDYLEEYGTNSDLHADDTRFKIVKHDGTTGSLVHNDVVHIKNVGINKYLKSSSNGKLSWVTSKSSSTRWQVKRKSVGSGTVRAIDEVNFKSMVNDEYLEHRLGDAINPVAATTTSTTGSASWRILVLPQGSNVFPSLPF